MSSCVTFPIHFIWTNIHEPRYHRSTSTSAIVPLCQRKNTFCRTNGVQCMNGVVSVLRLHIPSALVHKSSLRQCQAPLARVNVRAFAFPKHIPFAPYLRLLLITQWIYLRFHSLLLLPSIAIFMSFGASNNVAVLTCATVCADTCSVYRICVYMEIRRSVARFS